MWKSIEMIIAFVLKVLGRKLEGKEPLSTTFLKARKELRKSQVWVLEIFENSPSTRFSTREVFDIWEPLIVFRTSRRL